MRDGSGSQDRDRAALEAEVRKLAPWYYAFDLHGVRTDATEPLDEFGHRSILLPGGMERLLAGKTVLDVGCNEGAYSFEALDRGARRVDGFDCRAVNIEKARFVARVLGHDRAAFHVATCESWIEGGPDPVDFVFLCGILNHLADPEETIRQYCALAREGVAVTTGLWGGGDGYSPAGERDTVAAGEDPGMTAMVPNTVDTLLGAFGREGFHPVHLAEGPGFQVWGGVGMLLLRRRGWREAHNPRGASARAIGIHVVPRGPDPGAAGDQEVEVAVTLRNRTPREQAVRGVLEVKDRGGSVLWTSGPRTVRLGPCYPTAPTCVSEGAWLEVPVPARPGTRIEVRIEGDGGGDAEVLEWTG